MRKYLTLQQGFTLIELLISITLMSILLSGMLNVFSANLATWTAEKRRITMQQTGRIAADRIIRDVRYAQDVTMNTSSSLTITKYNGERSTFQLGGGLHDKTLYLITDKTQVVPAGGIASNPITENIVTKLLFAAYPDSGNLQAVIITLEVTDSTNSVKQVIHTAGYPLNMCQPPEQGG